MQSQILREQIQRYNLNDLSAYTDGNPHIFSGTQIKAAESGETEENKREYESVAVTSKPTRRGQFVDPKTSMPNIAKMAREGNGKPMMINHWTWDKSLPIGRTTSGEFNKEAEEVRIGFFIDDLDEVPDGKRVIAGIDSGSITEVSFSGYGKFVCSFDDTRMGWYGCEHGHYPLMKIMLDKNGKETDDPDKMVKTETIYAKFIDATLEELSIAWSGAIPGVDITKKYTESEQAAVDQARRLHEEGIFSESNLQTFSMLSNIAIDPTAEDKTLVPVQFTPNTNPNNGGPNTMSVDAQMQIQELENTKKQLTTERDQALAEAKTAKEKVADYDTKDAQLTAALKRIKELEGEVQELSSLRAKAKEGEAYVVALRAQLKAKKKNQTHVSQDDKNAFYARVDQMTSVHAMLSMLVEMSDQSQSNEEFLEVISSPPEPPESVHSQEYVEKQTAARLRNFA